MDLYVVRSPSPLIACHVFAERHILIVCCVAEWTTVEDTGRRKGEDAIEVTDDCTMIRTIILLLSVVRYYSRMRASYNSNLSSNSSSSTRR